MSEEIEFPNGIIYKAPSDKAPDFVKGTLSIKIEEAIQWLNTKRPSGEWVNLDIKISKKGKAYLSVNTWEKKNSAVKMQNNEGKPNITFEDVSD